MRCFELRDVGSIPARPANLKETDMEFKNRLNGELFFCENPRMIQEIEGVEYLIVSKPGSSRQFLIRKDVLEKVSSNIKSKKKKVLQ